LTDIFLDKSIKVSVVHAQWNVAFNVSVLQLRDVWSAMTAASEYAVQVDVMLWLSRMTLDVIGLAGVSSTEGT